MQSGIETFYELHDELYDIVTRSYLTSNDPVIDYDYDTCISNLDLLFKIVSGTDYVERHIERINRLLKEHLEYVTEQAKENLLTNSDRLVLDSFLFQQIVSFLKVIVELAPHMLKDMSFTSFNNVYELINYAKHCGDSTFISISSFFDFYEEKVYGGNVIVYRKYNVFEDKIHLAAIDFYGNIHHIISWDYSDESDYDFLVSMAQSYEEDDSIFITIYYLQTTNEYNIKMVYKGIKKIQIHRPHTEEFMLFLYDEGRYGVEGENSNVVTLLTTFKKLDQNTQDESVLRKTYKDLFND